MRLETIGYCANVHPGTSVEALCRNLAHYSGPVRRRLGLTRQAVGLWICEQALQQLQQPQALAQLQQTLQQQGLYILSLNGFPQRDFHQPVVKQAVYRPDWSEPERLTYSQQLALLLCQLGQGPRLSISTLPLGYASDWSPAQQQAAERHLLQLVAYLARLEQVTGIQVQFGLEMEPGCVLELSHQLVTLFDRLAERAGASGLDPALIPRHLGACYDVCHQAVMWEDTESALDALHQAGISLVKIQLSSALAAAAGSQPALAPFAEPRYLHQSCAWDGQARKLCSDLPLALAGGLPLEQPWRVHFHVPLQQAQPAPGLGSTQQAIRETLAWLARHPEQKPHLEVETYSWQVLPGFDGSTQALLQGLEAELRWLHRQLPAGLGRYQHEEPPSTQG